MDHILHTHPSLDGHLCFFHILAHEHSCPGLCVDEFPFSRTCVQEQNCWVSRELCVEPFEPSARPPSPAYVPISSVQAASSHPPNTVIFHCFSPRHPRRGEVVSICVLRAVRKPRVAEQSEGGGEDRWGQGGARGGAAWGGHCGEEMGSLVCSSPFSLAFVHQRH